MTIVPSSERREIRGDPHGGPVSQLFRIDEPSGVGEARRSAAALATRLGLDEAKRGEVSLIASEAATNLARHAREGVLVLRALDDCVVGGVEVMALDRGPGIADEFDLYSSRETGTALVTRVWSDAHRPPNESRERQTAVVCVPLRGEHDCGDAWTVLHQRDQTLIALVDGLGHGPDAAVAADAAIAVVRDHADASPVEMIKAAHLALRSTRGAAMAVATIGFSDRVVRFAGIGNIAATVLTLDGSRSLASFNGTVGHEMRSVQEYVQPWTADSTLVMHSDGITNRWRLDTYRGLSMRHASLVAGVIFRDFARGRDDATVLVVRDPIRRA